MLTTAARGATPDYCISCESHEPGIWEMKCPYITGDAVPSHANVDCLVKRENLTQLNRNHNYYFQTQDCHDRQSCREVAGGNVHVKAGKGSQHLVSLLIPHDCLEGMKILTDIGVQSNVAVLH